jgi:capsular exopolysaccharide synthesis family protein
MDQRIREVDEVRGTIDLPLLGAVPMTELGYLGANGEQGTLPPSSYYAFKESLSSLALNLRYLGADNMMKVIAFTSSVPSEGKSTLIYNLALILSTLDYRVLLVDADMRKPNIHKLAKLSNKFGLTTALATPSPWQDLIHIVDDKDRLHIITAGSTPPNPMFLLDSDKMTSLCQEWRREYDYVLVDTPPIVGISDTQCLTNKVDTFVVVAAINRSTSNGIAKALDILERAKGNISGILINMISSNDNEYYYNYYDDYYLKAGQKGSDDLDQETFALNAIESAKDQANN